MGNLEGLSHLCSRGFLRSVGERIASSAVCKADFMVSLGNGSVPTALFGEGAVWWQPLPSGEF